MPVNRAESVRGLVTRCRESADGLYDEPKSSEITTAKIDLRQAANEIENLAGIVDNEESAFYGRLRRAITQALGEFFAREGDEEPWYTTDGGDKMVIKVTTTALTVETAINFQRRHPA